VTDENDPSPSTSARYVTVRLKSSTSGPAESEQSSADDEPPLSQAPSRTAIVRRERREARRVQLRIEIKGEGESVNR